MNPNDKVWQLAFRDFRALAFIYILFLAMLFLLKAGFILLIIFGLLCALMVWLSILFKNHDPKATTIGFPLVIFSFVLTLFQLVLSFTQGIVGLQEFLNMIVQGYLIYRVNTVRKLLSGMSAQAQTPPIHM